MREISYTQIWGMQEWAELHHGQVRRAFNTLDEIQWLQNQGFEGRISRHYEDKSDNFHITITFDVPDDIYTFFILKWPDEVLKVDFDGPTIKGNNYASQSREV